MATEFLVSSMGSYASGAFAGAHPVAAQQLGALWTAALFTGLSSRECAEVVGFGRTRTFARDEVLFVQGQPVRSFILLEFGTVKQTQLSRGGDEVLLRMSGAGDAINAQSAARGGVHNCSARAVDVCRTLVWEHGRLQEMLDKFPQVRRNMSRIVDGHLQEMEERFRELATERVARRLALALERLMRQVGKKCEDGVQVSLSREELAQMTGTTLFTISRVLSKWADMGLVIPRRSAVVIRDAARLAAASEMDC